MTLPKIPSREENERAAALRKAKKESAQELLEALETLNLVIGLTPIIGNKDALQEACDIARAAITKAKQITNNNNQ